MLNNVNIAKRIGRFCILNEAAAEERIEKPSRFLFIWIHFREDRPFDQRTEHSNAVPNENPI